MLNEEQKYRIMSEIMKAMAHPTRLKILDLLDAREHCVCELQQAIGSDMSTISKHLTVLRTAGLIGSRKVNNQVWYKLLCPCVLDFYTCMTKVRTARDV